MKNILFALAIVLIIGLTANAQGRDVFFRGWNDDTYNGRSGGDSYTPGIIMPGNGIFGKYENSSGAPLGSGILVLTALAAGYAVYRKKRGK